MGPFSFYDTIQLRGASVSLRQGANQYTVFGGTTVPFFYLTLGSTRDVAGFSYDRQQSSKLDLFANTSFINAPRGFLRPEFGAAQQFHADCGADLPAQRNVGDPHHRRDQQSRSTGAWRTFLYRTQNDGLCRRHQLAAAVSPESAGVALLRHGFAQGRLDLPQPRLADRVGLLPAHEHPSHCRDHPRWQFGLC